MQTVRVGGNGYRKRPLIGRVSRRSGLVKLATKEGLWLGALAKGEDWWRWSQNKAFD